MWKNENNKFKILCKKCLHYYPKSGNIRWQITRGSKAPKGSIAGTLRSDGYRVIKFYGKYFYAHRIAWLLYYGKWHRLELDHRDGVGSNNKIKNLRLATRSQNEDNKKLSYKNKTGYKGVFEKRKGVFQAILGHNKKYIYLGYYSTAKLAAHAIDIEVKKLNRKRRIA